MWEDKMTGLVRICCACNPNHLYGCVTDKRRECKDCEERETCWVEYHDWKSLSKTHGYCPEAMEKWDKEFSKQESQKVSMILKVLDYKGG
jgi:hypothetical protein